MNMWVAGLSTHFWMIALMVSILLPILQIVQPTHIVYFI